MSFCYCCCCFCFRVWGFHPGAVEACALLTFPVIPFTIEGMEHETEGPSQHKEDEFWKQNHLITSQLGDKH